MEVCLRSRQPLEIATWVFDEMVTKICNKCEIEKPIDMFEFYKASTTRNTCKQCRIRMSLKGILSKKDKHTEAYIGCTVKFLRKWLEYQFKDGMSWDNMSEWHIDHVKPCASFDLTDKSQLALCFSWKNLQPLWKQHNMSKSAKIDNTLIANHNKMVTIFLAQVKEGELLEHP